VAATELSEVDGPSILRSTTKDESTSLHSVAATQLELAGSLPDAVKLASKLAKPGDIVLLSPACASYDMFENYEQRGQQFTSLVKSLDK